MQEVALKYRKLIIIGILVFGVLLVAWEIFYSVFVFHLTSTTPSLTRVSDQAPYIDVVFNKPIDKTSVRLTSNDVSISSDVDGGKLRINILELMSTQKAYTITIDSITSTSKDTIKNYVLTFTPKGDDSYLTADQQTAILNKQEAHKSPVLSDVIFQYIPYSTLDYSLDGVIGSDNSITITITIQLSTADINGGRDAAIAQYKQAAMTYLTSLKGVDLSKYTITTTVIDPS